MSQAYITCVKRGFVRSLFSHCMSMQARREAPARDEDEVPTKRQSGTLFVVRDLAVETAAKLEIWSADRLLVDNMQERHAALASKSIAAMCRDCLAQLEVWFVTPPSQEERKALIDRVLTLRDHAQELLAPFGVTL